MACVVVFLGPAGSGKTTLARAVREQLIGRRVAYLYNDDGRNVPYEDDGITGSFDAATAVLGGCFGCRDSESFRREVRKIQSDTSFQFLLIEPLGFIEGGEIVSLLRGMGITPRVISLLDVEHLHDNEVIGTVPSQLREATAGIGLTHCPEGVASLDDERLVGPLEYIALHAAGNTSPVFLVRPGEGLPEPVLARTVMPVGEWKFYCAPSKKTKKHAHDHTHGAHGHMTYSYPLHENVSLDDVRRAFQSLGANVDVGISRVKGVVRNRWFHAVWDSWKSSSSIGGRPFVIFYATRPINPEFLRHLMVIDDAPKEADTRIILRDNRDVSVDATERYIRKAMHTLPTTPLYDTTGPITHPEPLELLNNICKRPGVSSELVQEYYRARVSYFLAVAEAFTPESVWWNTPDAARRKLDLVISVLWFAMNKSGDLGEVLMSRVSSFQGLFARMLEDGLRGLAAYHTDLNTAIIFIDDIKASVQFLGSTPALLSAVECAIVLARKDGRSALANRWR